MSFDPNNFPMLKIECFCGKWKITEFALFGSVLREDFGGQSDIDVLVSFSPEAKPTLFHLALMQSELSEIFGRDVDILTRRGVENSRNPIRKKQILSTAQTIYAA